MADQTHQPLRGAIVCCTSIAPEQRHEIAICVEQMGGVHKYDLTSDVTHLIVGDVDTPKYKFVAKERGDVKCLLSSWVPAIRESWMAGEETDMAALEKQHQLPVFYELRICLTGFLDDQRRDLEKKIIANGGQYKPNLTKDETHLVAKEPAGAKYDFAQKFAIKTVSVEWILESLERGMSLDETLFNPLWPMANRGVGAWRKKTESPSLARKRARASAALDDTSASNVSRKLRRTASAKLESQNSGLWRDLACAAVVKQEPDQTKNTAGMEDDDGPRVAPLRSTKSKSAEVRNNPEFVQSNGDDDPARTTRHVSTHETSLGTCKLRGLFDGFVFVLDCLCEQKRKIARDHLRPRGARLLSVSELAQMDDKELPKTIYVVHDHSLLVRPPPISYANVKAISVTDLWLERCLYSQKLENPQSRLVSQPFLRRKLHGFENMIISRTGFQGIELLHLSKIIKLTGARYAETLESSTTVIICNGKDAAKEKLRHAYLWSIPAVSPDWLLQCLKESERIGFENFLVQPVESKGETQEDHNHPRPLDSDPSQARPTPPSRKTNQRRPASSKGTSKLERKGSSMDKGSRKQSISLLRAERAGKHSFPDSTGPAMLKAREERSARPRSDHENPARSASLSDEQSMPLQELDPNAFPAKLAIASDQLQPHQTMKPQSHDGTKGHPSGLDQENNDERNSDALAGADAQDQDDTLAPTITSLLAQHQQRQDQKQRERQLCNGESGDSTNVDGDNHQRGEASRSNKLASNGPRRRRQLLGRAPSNVSSHQYSRASSIDTNNTDGCGTPLQQMQQVQQGQQASVSSRSLCPSLPPSRPASESNVSRETSTTNLPIHPGSREGQDFSENVDQRLPIQSRNSVVYDEPCEEEMAERALQQKRREEEGLGGGPMLTQIGYEDTNVKLWRDRVDAKISSHSHSGSPSRRLSRTLHTAQTSDDAEHDMKASSKADTNVNSNFNVDLKPNPSVSAATPAPASASTSHSSTSKLAKTGKVEMGSKSKMATSNSGMNTSIPRRTRLATSAAAEATTAGVCR